MSVIAEKYENLTCFDNYGWIEGKKFQIRREKLKIGTEKKFKKCNSLNLKSVAALILIHAI